MKATYILVWAATRDTFVTNGGRPARANPTRIYGIKRRSVLFDLLYWEELHGKAYHHIQNWHHSYVVCYSNALWHA